MATDISIPDVLYFQHRLTQTSAAQLPASTAFDLARSPLDNQAVGQATQQFGAPPIAAASPANGWGISSFMSHLVSTRPDTVKADDLAQVQQKLIDSGFMPSGTPTSGAWDPGSEAAFTQWEQQQSNDFYAGHHPLATTTQKALMTLGWMLPSRVFQGIVGAAKGFVMQAPETIGRVGALGGAAGGAAIGAAVGSVVPVIGTAIGAAGGAAVGGLLGFFEHHDTNQDNAGWSQNVWDSLVPYDEYKGPGGAQKFWEDLGWIGTAAALVTGVGAGASAAVGSAEAGAESGLLGIGANAESSGTDLLTQALTKAPPVAPGWSSKLLATPAKMFGADAYAQTNEFFRTQGLIAQASRPIIKDVITPAFTGVASAQFAARIASSVGSGNTQTTINKAIQDAPLPQGTLGTLMDATAFIVQPTQWLPWKLGDLSRGIQNLTEGDVAFEPFVNNVRRLDPTLSRDAAVAKARDVLGSTPAEQQSVLTAMHLEHGIESMAMAKVKALGGFGREDPLFGSISNDIREAIIGENATGNPLVGARTEMEAARGIAAQTARKPSLMASADNFKAAETSMPVTREAMSYGFNDPLGLDGSKGPAAFDAYLTRLTDAGSGPEAFPQYFSATQAGKRATEAVRADPNIALTTNGDVMSPGVIAGADRTRALDLQNQADRLKKDIAKRQLVADTADPTAAIQIKQELRVEKTKLKQLQDAAKSYNAKPTATWEDKMVVPLRKDTPTNGTYMKWWSELDDLQHRVATQYKGLGDATSSVGLEQAKAARNDWLFAHEDHLPAKTFEQALVDNTGKLDAQEVLQRRAMTAAQDVVLPQEHMDAFDAAGYKPGVIHQRNSFEYAVDPKILEATGINDLTRRPAFFDSIGLGMSKTSDASIAKLRSVTTENLLDQLSAEKGWGFSGRKLLARLHTGLQQSNSEGVITNDTVRGLTPLTGEEPSVKLGLIVPTKGSGGSLRHAALDVRDIRPGDVFEAMRDLPNFDHEDAVAVYSALQRGGAMGAELNFKAPVATMHELGRVLKVNGFQGFSDLARTWHLQAPGEELAGIKFNAKRLALTTGGGAALGYYLSDGKGDRLGDAIRGAGVGLATGLGVELLAKRSYGFLPDYLHKVAMSLRYSLSPSFDVRRFVKQNLLASSQHDLPPLMNGKHYLLSEGPSIEGAGSVSGEAAKKEALALFDRIQGGAGIPQAVDDFDRTLTAAGITGYNPQARQIAHGYMLARKGMPESKIAGALKDIYSYGIGRSAAEKSANYVFFPFSFEKKVISALGDFILQNPGRSLMIYEGARRFYQSTYATDVQDFMQKHVPLLSQLQEFNAFSHGLSPGRFFLEGIVGDPTETHRTNTGKAAQILSNFFIPGGGAMTPLQESVGGIGDMVANYFAPQVVTGQSITKMGYNLKATSGVQQLTDLASKYIPLVKDTQELYSHAIDQAHAGIGSESMSSQLNDYYSGMDRTKAALTPLAYSMGYSSVDGFLQSQDGAPYKAQVDEKKYQLQTKYPDAFNASVSFEDKSALQDKALQDVLHSSNTSSAYEAIRQIAFTQKQLQLTGDLSNSSQVFAPIIANSIRQIAIQHADDPRFAELWQQIFESTYGPIRMEAA